MRLCGPARGRRVAGRWCDAATGEHGDLLDLIRLSCGLETLRDAMDEAYSFLHEPRSKASAQSNQRNVRFSSQDAARRLFATGQPIVGTLAERYLRGRGITVPLDDLWSLRFNPGCYYRATQTSPRETWPALLAAITDLSGTIKAVHRVWLDRDGSRKAPVLAPRRSLGDQLGSGVRLGLIRDVLTVGEGLETLLSLRSALPSMPMLAGLSAGHLAGIELPSGLRRLYVAHDNDSAGRRAHARLLERCKTRGVMVLALRPLHADFNVDLNRLGPGVLSERVKRQIVPEDWDRFSASPSTSWEGVEAL